MKAIVKRVGADPAVEDIGADLRSLQTIVGGLIEPYRLDEKTDLICNDEGKILGMPMNVAIGIRPEGEDEGDIADIICGDIIIVGVNSKEGEYVDLTDEQTSMYMRKMSTSYLLTNHFELLPVIELF